MNREEALEWYKQGCAEILERSGYPYNDDLKELTGAMEESFERRWSENNG